MQSPSVVFLRVACTGADFMHAGIADWDCCGLYDGLVSQFVLPPTDHPLLPGKAVLTGCDTVFDVCIPQHLGTCRQLDK